MVLTCYPDELAAQTHLSELEAAEAEFASQHHQQRAGAGGGGPVVAASQEAGGMLQLD